MNIAVVENGQTTLYRSKWGGDGLDMRLFFGPARALDYARSNPEAARDSGWYGDDAQGGALIDCDAQRLLCFCGAELSWDVFYRTAWLDLMARQWPGWRVEWAVEGIFEIRAALDGELEPQKAFTEGFALDPSDALEGDMLLSWRAADGARGARRMNGAIDALWIGPKNVSAALDALTDLPAFREADNGWIDCGAHVDFQARHLAFWSAAPTPFPEFNAARTWRGWEIEWLRDDWRAQISRVPLTPSFPDMTASRRSALQVARDALENQRAWLDQPEALSDALDRLAAEIDMSESDQQR